jgi:hypothetical protein
MPIIYTRHAERRLITVTVTEPYTVEDIVGAIDRQAAEGAWEYAMLYDLRATTRLSTEGESMQIADYVTAVGRGLPRGPVGLAVRATPEQFRRRLTRNLTTIEVLLTTAQLDDWVARNAPHRKRPQT